MEAHQPPDGHPWVLLSLDAETTESEFLTGALLAAKTHRARVCLNMARAAPFARGDGFPPGTGPVGRICRAHDLSGLPRNASDAAPCVLWGDGRLEDRQPDANGSVSICAVDNRAVGRLAADYFLRRKRFRSFVYVDAAADSRSAWWRRTRAAAFEAALAAAGRRPVVRLRLPDPFGAPALARFGARLRRLPAPVAMFASSEAVAWDAVHCCTAAGLAVPGTVAVLGVDDEKGLSGRAEIPISSIRLEYGRLGRLAMNQELRMLLGADGGRKILVKPLRVIERETTNGPGAGDVFVVRALACLARAGSTRLTAADLVRTAGASRRYLELRFKAETGQTLLQAVQARTLAAVRRLATETDLSVAQIAARAGLSCSGLCTLFRRAYGTTITAFRRTASAAEE